MRKITKRMAREIYTKGFVVTKKYQYYENKETGSVYRIPSKMLDRLEALDIFNHEYVISHEELCDLAF